MQQNIRSNFDMLRAYEPQLWRLGALAERYFAEDPNTSLLKQRQFAELLAQNLAARGGLYTSQEESQYELIRRLQSENLVPREIKQVFDQIRVTGNSANHALAGDHAKALATLKLAWQLSLWFHRTFKQPDFKSGPFVPPAPPQDESKELEQELAKLRQAVSDYQSKHEQAATALHAAQTQLTALGEERSVWEQIATESDQAKAKLAAQLAELQTQAKAAPPDNLMQLVVSANKAATLVELDEAETRRMIDAQLRQAGWEADTEVLKYSKGARPEKGHNLAIAEWPCEGYSADYVLFRGLVPMAVVEAKRHSKDVSADLQQSKRYSRTFSPSAETQLHAQNWGVQSEFRIPFVFATIGRPYLRQLATKSGIWFCDLRDPKNRSAALDGWYSPEGLQALLRQDEGKAHAELDNTPFNYGFPLRHYQQAAIRATESSIAEGQREILLAMATGIGAEKPVGPDKPYAETVAALSPALTDLLASLEDYTLSFGDDVQRKELRLYVAFKRLKNFATLVPQKGRLLLYLHLDAAKVMRLLPSAKDVSQKGHWGTGDVEVPLASMADLEAAKPFIAEAYEGRSQARGASHAE